MNDNYHTELQESLSHEAIVKALFEKYESLYAVDIETSAYQCFHESDPFSSLRLESAGDDFFNSVAENIARTVHPDDQKYVRAMLSREALLAGVTREKYYSFVYRLVIDGKPLYHKLRATLERVNQRPHFLIGVRNIDAAYRLDRAHEAELSAMQRKEINHLEAILASAEEYMEANLTKNRVLELSKHSEPSGLPKDVRFPALEESISYSDFERWRIENLIAGNREKYIKVSDRNYLIRCFERGERRASVSFSKKTASGCAQPCKKVFYLYRDEATGDVLAFCVIYDLTEQQRKEKELRDLERELQMSRMRNFTSQMQPHFLYNALSSIQEIVLDDPQYASKLIGDFTIHLRSCIRAMASDAPIPFDQELANVRAYVNIEKMRFGDKLEVVYDVQASDFSILPLTVQPIVENAIRHGIYERGAQGGEVRLRTAEREDAWVIEVHDDGVGFDVEAYRAGLASGERDSTGIRNIIFRLDKVMGATVKMESRPDVGTTVTIEVPKKRRKSEETEE